MDRQELIKNTGNQFMEPVLYQSFTALLQAYKRDEERIFGAFQNALEELYSKAKEMQLSGKKDSLSSLGICYCLSSVYTGNYEVRLDVYNEEFYLDESECCVYWEPDFIVSYLVEDMEYFRKVIKQKISQIKIYEEQQFLTGYMRNYMYALLEFLRQEMPNVPEQMQKRGIQVAEEFQVFFGEYMGKYVLMNQ